MLLLVIIGILFAILLALNEHNQRERLDRLYPDDPSARRQAELDRIRRAKMTRIVGLVFGAIVYATYMVLLAQVKPPVH